MLYWRIRFPVYLVTSNGWHPPAAENELLFSHNISSEAIKSVLSLWE
jgi:hypothetical protein